MSFWWTVAAIVLGMLIGVALYDIIQRKHAILHNFPIVGHLRYFIESIGPEIRQYLVANDKEEMPFNRDERRWVYASSKGENNRFGFGTTEQIYGIGYPVIKHAAFPFPEEQATYPGDDPTCVPCTKVMGKSHGRRRPYRPMSIVNVSAMSFGALSGRAIEALNRGAADAGCYHNTGEGGISRHHLHGADLVWQLGTGYFGARREGRFSLEEFRTKVAQHPQVRAIEIKLSQGAKPAKGGILPGVKVNHAIAEARGIPVGQDCVSPNGHREFSTVSEMIDFIEQLADVSGLPVGIKSAVGEMGFWEELADQMEHRGVGPDFIAIDGSEGGTGAAPLTFTDHVSLPFKIGMARVYRLFLERGLQDRVVWVGSAKLGFPDRALVAMAMGCDVIQVAREAMLAIGCIQAQKCHNNHCPTGVATQNPWLVAGLDPDQKAERFARYVRTLRKELVGLAHACGYEHPSQVQAVDIEFSTGVNEFRSLADVLGYSKPAVQIASMSALEATS